MNEKGTSFGVGLHFSDYVYVPQNVLFFVLKLLSEFKSKSKYVHYLYFLQSNTPSLKSVHIGAVVQDITVLFIIAVI